jgi:hypothetical protein
MSIFQHLVPANVFGRSQALSPVAGTLLVHDVERSVYAQVSASPIPATKVGYIPCTGDGVGGITQLARDLDARFYSQTTTGLSSSLSGTTLTVVYPNVNVLWNGVVQTLAAGSISGTVSTGLWSLVVGYLWGLNQVQLVATSSLDPAGNYVELCEINVNTSSNTAVLNPGKINLKFFQSVGVGSNGGTALGSSSTSIPVSNGIGNMPW